MLRRRGYQLLKPGDLERLLRDRMSVSADRRNYLLAHPLVNGTPPIRFASEDAADNPTRHATATRLINAYRRAAEEENRLGFSRQGGDLWTNLVDTELAGLLHILHSGDANALSRYLLKVGEQPTWFGGLSFGQDGYVDTKDTERTALVYLDKIICLAEALGVIPLEHPEHGRWGENLYLNLDSVVAKVQEQLGIDIEPPRGAVFVSGVKTSHGLFHYRHLNALYTARLITSMASPGRAISEYGGGLGTVALYARRFGFSNYTLFDIPITNLFAGNFLINALGPDAVTLLGEQPKAESITVLPYWHCRNALEQTFDLTLNQDSFPEIDEGLVLMLLTEIKRTTRSTFLSINHEAESRMTDVKRQLNVSKILRSLAGYRRISRQRYWLREGYAEELYQVQH